MSKQLAIRVSDDLYERLKADAAAYGRTITQSVRYWLDEGLSWPTPTFTPSPVTERALQAMYGLDSVAVPIEDTVKIALIDNSED